MLLFTMTKISIRNHLKEERVIRTHSFSRIQSISVLSYTFGQDILTVKLYEIGQLFISQGTMKQRAKTESWTG